MSTRFDVEVFAIAIATAIGWFIITAGFLAAICFGFWLHFHAIDWRIEKHVKQECLLED